MHKSHQHLYSLNFSLLATHEVDSAYWHEWNLFGIPGGIQFFLFINFVLFAIAIFGYSQLLKQKRSGYLFSLLLAVSGIFTFSIHTYFILSGYMGFTLLGSKILLGTIFFASLSQGILALQYFINNGFQIKTDQQF